MDIRYSFSKADYAVINVFNFAQSALSSPGFVV